MKKTYSKPDIVFEDFSLSSSIAGTCNVIVNNSVENSCAYFDERNNKYVFTNEIAACTTKNQDGDGICYHIPLESNDLFNS